MLTGGRTYERMETGSLYRAIYRYPDIDPYIWRDIGIRPISLWDIGATKTEFAIIVSLMSSLLPKDLTNQN